ncbi:NAD(P)H-dependent oxidoreductase [Nocardia cyriacigeorgica]|uniref:flavodoxin family protein n=1 Tax=Nocardia cyriacigeorgica TaxID=135487 RepID=UPI001892E09B|nr:NAD(P)H-dependent oxidoreductase [Nocardia cyriacigeorgica]MBF6095464.1 NAD(P)H-dependent oxidoreductase [Nocardia cyriacigeorgica]MBF6396645.1 NAD(P)H-dependent oxidoreductase [Nocardia cyriacigeorgica]MBF6402277.1 NAD(P)H-dependent oxidoreductase [Nocardia cyriacigeorgica]
MDELSAVALVCTLKKSPAESSSDLLARQVLAEFAQHQVRGEIVRVVDYDVLPGVTADEGEGDQWPQIREKILAADILLVSTPTWLGHMSSVAQRMLERLDAELSNTDDRGRPAMFDKVATSAVVGNEDGAHKITADLFQALDDIGFSIPGQDGTYWNGEAMSGVDYLDLDSVPKAVATTNATLARNAAHLARLLRAQPYPA